MIAIVLAAILGTTAVGSASAPYTQTQILAELTPPLSNESWRDAFVAGSESAVWILRARRTVERYSVEANEKAAFVRTGAWSLPATGIDAEARLAITASGDVLWLIDRKTRRAWSLENGKWRSPVALPDAIGGVAALSPRLLVVNTPEHSSHAFAIVDSSAAVIRRFGGRETPAFALLAGPANTWVVTSMANGDIAAAHAHRGLLRRYRPGGELVWERRVETAAGRRLETLRREVEAKITVDPKTCCIESKMVPFATAVLPAGDGLAVRMGLDPSIDYFDAEGRWRAATPVTTPSDVWITAGLALIQNQLVAMELTRVVAFARGVGRVVSGRVVDTSGNGVPAAKVEVRADAGRRVALTTDAEGRFVVSGFGPAETGQLAVSADDFLPLRRVGVLHELTGERLVVERRPEQCVVVRSAATGEPVKNFRLVVGELSSDQTTVRRSDGVARQINSEEGRGCVRVPFAPPLYARIAADGFARAEVELSAAGVAQVALNEEVPVRVHVAAPDKAPVAGARVYLRPRAEAKKLAFALPDEAIVTTDEKGEAALRGVAAGQYTLVAEHDDFLRWERELEIEAGAAPIEVVFDRGGRIEISVKAAATGQALADSIVRAERRGPIVPRPLSCTTGADGRCTISGLPDGRYNVRAEYARHARAQESLAVGPPDRFARVELSLADAASVSGRVRGVENYPGVRLDVLIGKPGVPSVRAPVGTDGEFALSEAPTGSVNVWIVESGGVGSTLVHQRQQIASGGARLEIELPAQVRVRGRILSASGTGCGACTMTFGWQGGEFGKPNRAAVVARDGAFSAVLPNAGPYTVSIEDPVSGAKLVESVELRGNVERDFRLGASALRVQAKFEDGRPASGALIAVAVAEQTLIERNADSSGAVQFEGLPAKRLRVTASSGGRVASREVELSGTTQSVTLELPARDPLRLRVIDAASRLPVPRISVRVTTARGESLVRSSVTPETDGAFTIPSLSSEPMSVVVSALGYAMRTMHGVVPAGEPLPVLLTPGARNFAVEVDTNVVAPCALEIRGVDNRPLAVSFDAPPGPVPFTTRSATFSWLEWGTYEVRLHDCGGRTLRKPLVLMPGGDAVVRFP